MSNTIIKYLPTKKQVPQVLKWGAGIGIALGIFFMGKKIYKNIDLIREKNLLQSTVTAGGESYDLGGSAGEIYDAFYNNDIFGATEDEERAISILTAIPDEYITDLSNIYYKLYGKILKADFIKYLSPEQYERVKDKFA